VERDFHTALCCLSSIVMMPSFFSRFSTYPVQENGIDYKIPTAVTTSLVNIVGVSLKDRAFARMMKKSASSFPLSSYLLFGIRDGMTVTSTFVLKVRSASLPPFEHPCSSSPPQTGPLRRLSLLDHNFFCLVLKSDATMQFLYQYPALCSSPLFSFQNTVRDHLVEDLSFRPRYADIAASFAVPMLAQIPFTPLHILAMDLYVRKGKEWRGNSSEGGRERGWEGGREGDLSPLARSAL